MEHTPFGDDSRTRCQYYRLVCGLPAHIDPPALGWISFNVGSTAAITMPMPLGQQVRGHMQRAGNETGPIIAHTRSSRWTFLIRPDIPEDDNRLFSEMFRLNVHISRCGAAVALPSPAQAIRDWVEPPHSTFRPSGIAVVEAIRVCAGSVRESRSLAVHRG